jgi:hypothetical protein
VRPALFKIISILSLGHVDANTVAARFQRDIGSALARDDADANNGEVLCALRVSPYTDEIKPAQSPDKQRAAREESA